MAKRSNHTNGSATAALFLALLALATSAASAAATYEQVFVLQPGWNAVFLEVQPHPSEVAEVLAGVPVASVWTYDARYGGSVRDLVDPARGLIEATGWFGFFPEGRDEAVLTNLYHLRANRAYLVRLEGDQPVEWRVAGRPSVTSQRWEPDSFSLVGFHVDPDNPPSFGSWFEASPAHYGQPIYRLDSEGFWQPVLPFFEPIRSGEAYWVWTHGVSEYQGPMEIELDLFDRLEFGGGGERSTIAIDNHHAFGTTMRLQLLDSSTPSTPVPLKYQTLDSEIGTTVWRELPAPLDLAAPGGEKILITLAPDRVGFDDRAEQILEINDSLGSRRLILVGANTVDSTTPNSFNDSGPPPDEPAPPPPGAPPRDTPAYEDRMGLWLGTATVRAVHELRCVPSDHLCAGGIDAGAVCDPDETNPCPGDAAAQPPVPAGACKLFGTCSVSEDVCDAERGDVDCPDGETCTYCTPVDLLEPTPTSTGFNLRVIVHVGADGTNDVYGIRLLKEVIQLFESPTYEPDPDTPGYNRVAEPGSYVLITDDALIPYYDGVAMRDGVPVGVRVATVAYDFDETSCNSEEGHEIVFCTYDDASKALLMVGDCFGAADPSDCTLNADFAIGSSFPTNPYRHPYHPDHDGDDPVDGKADLVQPPEIVRSISFEFRPYWGTCSDSPDGCDCTSGCDHPCTNGERCETDFLESNISAPPDWGSDTLGGIYRETITGIYREPIHVQGTFLLTRVAAIDELNP